MDELIQFIDHVEEVQKEVESIEKLKNISSNLIGQYIPFKEQYRGHFIFFQVGDFYELYDWDAERASKILSLQLTSRTIDGVTIPMCGFPAKSGENNANELARLGHKVLIVRQTKDENEVVTRSANQIITSSTISDDQYLMNDENQFLMAAYYFKNEMGVALVDTMSGEVITRLCHKFAIFDVISRYQPKEIGIYLTKDFEPEFLTRLKLIKNADIYKLPYFYEEMRLLIDSHKSQHFQNNYAPYSVIAAHYFALERLNAVQKQHVTLRPVQYVEERNFLSLHKTAVQGLELFENSETRKKDKSVFDLLNQCVTPKGGRKLRQWIQEPLIDPNEMEKRYELVDYFIKDSGFRGKLKEVLAQSNDIERILMRLETEKAKDRELVTLLDTLLVFEKALNIIDEHCTLRSLKESSGKLAVRLNQIVNDLVQKISVDTVIAKGYDERYDKIAELKENGLDKINEYLYSEQEKTGIKSMKIENNKILGYHFEVTKSQYDKIPDYFIVKKELSNKKQCVTEELVDLEHSYLQALEEHDSLYRMIVRQIVLSIKVHFDSIRALVNFFAKVDILMGFAEISGKYHYQRPNFTDNGIYIKNAKHPLLQAFSYQRVVPNNCFLPDNEIHIITGPNMGGKTVYKKTIALLLILAQVGCFVPADLRFKPVDRILVRIGASDSLMSNQSTFMMEMEDVAYILYHATENSLIIIDELGRGTSTNDGISIAHAVIEHIHNEVKAKTLCSTQFHELSEVEKALPNIKNVHAESLQTPDGIQLTYRIKSGVGSNSFGINVAEIAGIPTGIVKRSKELLDYYESKNA